MSALTDAQRKLLYDTKGWLENARLDCQKFEFRPGMGAMDMVVLGKEIEDIGAALIEAAGKTLTHICTAGDDSWVCEICGAQRAGIWKTNEPEPAVAKEKMGEGLDGGV